MAQASYYGSQPRRASSRISVTKAPSSRRTLGDLYLVLEGGNERLCSSFVEAAVAAYYAPATSSAISGLMACMRAGSNAAASAAGRQEEHLDLGGTGIAVRGGDLFIAQLPLTQLYIFRDGELSSRPESRPESPTTDNGLPFDKEIEILRADLVEGDTIALTSSVVASSLHEREIRGLLVRYPPEESAQQIAALAAQRGATECDVLILRSESQPMSMEPTSEESPTARRVGVGAAADGGPDSGVGRREPDWKATTIETTATVRERPPKGALQEVGEFLVGIGLLLLVLPAMLVKGIARVFSTGASNDSRARSGEPTAFGGQPPTSAYERRREAIAGGPEELEELNRAMVDSERGTVLKPWPENDGAPGSGIRGIWASLFGGRDPLLARNRRRSRIGPGSALLLFSIVALVAVVIILAIRREESPPETASQAQPALEDAEASRDTTQPPSGVNVANAFADAKRNFDAALRQRERAPALAGLQDAIDAANVSIKAGYNEAEVNRLLAQIQSEQDRLNQVYRLVTSATIGEFNETGVGIARLVPQLEVHQEFQYVIDAVEKRLIQYRVAKRGSTVLRDGEQVGQVAVKDIIGIVSRDLSLLVVDSDFNIFSIVPDRPAQLLRVSGTDEWKLPVAIDNFNNNLYVLDPAANRIHKYQPTANGYEVEPIDYFDPSEDVDVTSAIDMAIDGDVFILLSDGTIQRYRAGKPVRFQIRGLDRPISNATRIFTDVDADGLYVVDDGNKRIVELDKRDGNEGQFIRQFLYRGADDFFGDIRSIWISELDGRLLVLGRESLRQFVLPKRVE